MITAVFFVDLATYTVLYSVTQKERRPALRLALFRFPLGSPELAEHAPEHLDAAFI